MKHLLLIVGIFFSVLTYAAPKAELWEYWNESDEQNQQTISHQVWQTFLDKYLVKENDNILVRYQDVSSEDKKQLDDYLISLASLDPRAYSHAAQYAYWVNIYNALTVQLILDNYPTQSITKLGGLFSFGPWGDNLVIVAGKTLTLNDIEHRILRPIWQDARTHYAVNCASLGCPNLQAVAFNADNQEQLLEQAAKEFINSDKGISITNQQITLSSIYDWFAVDFGSNQELLEHFRKYRPALSVELKNVNYEYNWDLNKAD